MPDEDVASKDELTVMTYNIYMDGFLDSEAAQRTMKAMYESTCGIICLQECNQGWEDLLEADSSIRKVFPHRHFHHDMGKYGGRAILSRWPIVHHQWLPRIFDWWYGALFCRVELPSQKTVSIVSVHLRAPFPSNPLKVQKQRLQEIQQHMEHVKDEERLIVLGDFNNASGPSHQYMESAHNMVNCFRKIHPVQANFSCTWHHGPIGFLFDHIYAKGDSFNVKDSEIRKVGGSDHWPLIAVLELR